MDRFENILLAVSIIANITSTFAKPTGRLTVLTDTGKPEASGSGKVISGVSYLQHLS